MTVDLNLVQTYVLPIQVLTFVVLGTAFVLAGQYRLGIVQLLLAAVQAILYSGRMA